MARPLRIMLVAGEPSGDRLGAQLMGGLKRVALEEGRQLEISGMGGSEMEGEGLKSLFPLDATSVMGLREVVPAIPEILRRVRTVSDFARDMRPDVIVIIDSPDFTHRIARRVKAAIPEIRIANYAPPQVWASRPYRAKKMAAYIDAALTLLPFEADFFDRAGLRAIFVGYPVVERRARMVGGADFRRRHGIAPDANLLVVLPGSRRNEIRFILPEFKGAVGLLAKEIPGLVCVIPTIGHVAPLVREAARDWPTPVHVIESEDEKFASFDAADVALAASGTVTMELALSGTPMVVGYRAGRITHALARHLIRVPYVVLVNLILGREAVPEFLQYDCAPKPLSDALARLFTDEAARNVQISALGDAMTQLGVEGENPSLRAARAVIQLADGQ